MADPYADDPFVPGLFECPRCGFVLHQVALRAADGTVGARDKPGEKCPNDQSPMWRVTESKVREWERIFSETEAANG